MRRATKLTTLAIAASAALVAGLALPAAAGAGHHGHGPKAPVAGKPTTLVEHLAGPLAFDAKKDGRLYIAESFSGVVSTVKKGTSRVIAVGSDTTGVSERHGTVTWGEREGDEESIESSTLKIRKPNGKVTSIDLLAWETKNNPDGKVKYGFSNISAECAAQLPPFVPTSYTGLIDTHVYGTLSLRNATYIADAGANALLKVTPAGKVSSVAVLPPTTVTITAEMVQGEIPLPDCTIGLKYRAESVPTDVELGRDGWLYVTTLPGVPGLGGPFGSVYRVNPHSGAVKLVSTGFSGATGLAIAPNGTIFVAELFGGKISAITTKGKVSTFVEVDSPAALEWNRGKLLASIQVFGDGAIVAYPVKK